MIPPTESSYLKGKKILLGVCGSIAAYKSLILVRLLIKSGAEVQVLMTPSASDFIGTLSFSTLSKRSVFSSISTDAGWNNHVDLGLWADIMVVAPVTATTLAKLRIGLADNMVVASYLSARCPVVFAPAMDLDMWHHPSTQDNIVLLQKRGNMKVSPEYGELASGLTGQGRMAEPETIFQYLNNLFSKGQSLDGKKILINAGHTREPLDPIRYIGNKSTGKMGLSLAKEAKMRGAEVYVIQGHTTVSFDNQGFIVTKVSTGEEMFQATTALFEISDITILAAAVVDYKPAEVSDIKIKKNQNEIDITLVKTKDIAKYCGQKKRDNQILIGFALETNKEIAYATEKLKKKNLNFIVLNSLRDDGAGLEHDTNKVHFIRADNNHKEFELKSKDAVAVDIFNEIENLPEYD